MNKVVLNGRKELTWIPLKELPVGVYAVNMDGEIIFKPELIGCFPVVILGKSNVISGYGDGIANIMVRVLESGESFTVTVG